MISPRNYFFKVDGKDDKALLKIIENL